MRASGLRSGATFVALVIAPACGGAVIDTSAEDGEGGAHAACPSACADDDACCPGYVCDEGTCSPKLNDNRCWRAAFAAACDPRLEGPCSAGESCISEDLELVCRPFGHIVGLGDPCGRDDDAGCGTGLWCIRGFCQEPCCSDGDCPARRRCFSEHAQVGSFGVCLDAP